MGLNNPDWPDLDPGQFRNRVTLLEPTTTTDLSGVVTTYAPSAPPISAWAKKEYVRATDVIKSGQDVGVVYLKLTMWYRAEFAVPNKRLQDGAGKQFIIQAVENVLGVNTYLVLMCVGIGENN